MYVCNSHLCLTTITGILPSIFNQWTDFMLTITCNQCCDRPSEDYTQSRHSLLSKTMATDYSQFSQITKHKNDIMKYYYNGILLML